jgi:putative DNA primase/helicase
MRFWEDNFGGERGPSWTAATDALLRACERKGIFDMSKQRGRGAWFDSGRSVLHLGDRLLVDGKPTAIDAIDSRFIYEAGSQLEYEHAAPAAREQAHRLREITDMLFWERPIYSTCLSGWITIAPICGALPNRPHIWITGSAGTGKTHVLEAIIRPILGNFCLPVQSETTSAGVRQALGTDALPVMLDEFEGEDFAGQERVQKMLELARQAFSDSAAKIIKGGQTGKPTSYHVRSCFLMSSIAVNISKAADASRILVLSLARPHDTAERTKAQHFEDLCRLTTDVITESWAAEFRARSIAMIPTIRANSQTFAAAVADRIGNRRAGDQIGPLLAGAYSLSSDNLITPARAREYVASQDWTDQSGADIESDESRCLNMILQHIVRLPQGEISIAELLEGLKQSIEDNARDSAIPLKTDYDDTLKRHGIKYDHDEALIYISDSHQGIRRILHGSSWEKSWARILKRIPETVSFQGIRFFSIVTRASGIPMNKVFSV